MPDGVLIPAFGFQFPYFDFHVWLTSKQMMTEEISDKKKEIIHKIEAIRHPFVLQKIMKVIDEADTYQQLLQHDVAKEILMNEEAEDHSVQTHIAIPSATALSRYDARSAPWVFWLASFALVCIGLLVTAIAEDHLSPAYTRIIPFAAWLTSGLYLLFIVDFFVMLYLKNQSDQKVDRTEFIFRLLTLLFPPFRIGTRDITSGRYIWIPFWKWSLVTAGLFSELKRRFILPMILIALLIVPVLVVEWKFMEEAEDLLPDLDLELIMASIQDIVWTAFAFEFLLMFSLTNEKLKYCKKNWIDLLIILLPFVSFLRTFRFSQIARLKYATRSFKLRGVMTKTRQGLIFIDFIRRIFRIKPESELRRLQKMLRDNEQERKNLEQKLLKVAEQLKKENS